MEAKSTFVLILRSLPPHSFITRRPLRLDQVAQAAATTRNDGVMVRKGIRGIELLSQLQERRVLSRDDGFAALRDEVEQELVYLGSMKEKVVEEIRRLEEVFGTIRDHNAYLNAQLETYKNYLHNVRNQSGGKSRAAGGGSSSTSAGTFGGGILGGGGGILGIGGGGGGGGAKEKATSLGPYKFTHKELEKEGVIQRSNVPEDRRGNIYFCFASPMPGTFVISLHYKGMSSGLKMELRLDTDNETGRHRGLLELDLKLDDLLEMQKDNQEDLDLEYVQFNVSKVLALLNRKFGRKRGW